MRLFLLSLLAAGVFASLFLVGRGAFAEDAPAGSGNPPTISFYNADGEEVLLCQRGSWNRPPQQQ